MNIFGVHIDLHTVRICLLKKRGKRLEFSFVKEGKECKGRIASALPAKDFLIRNTELKAVRSKHIEEAIAFQSEATHHFKSEEILSVPLVQTKSKEKTEALVFTIPKEALSSHLTHLNSLGIIPDVVSTTATALTHFILWKFPEVQNAFVIDLGSCETSCIYIQNGKLKKAHSIEGGVEKLLNSLLEDRKRILLKKEIEGTAKQIDLLLLKPGLNPHLSNQLSLLRQKINQTYLSFCNNAGIDIIYTGRTDAFIHLREFLIQESNYQLTLEEQKYAVCMGLAIEQTSKNPLQLLSQEFFPPKNWKRLGLYATILSCATILLSGALFTLGSQMISSRTMEMVQATHRPFKGKVASQIIENWISFIEKNNQEYPYIQQAPTVTESLGWLTSHPLLQEIANEGDSIDIKSIRYQLLSFPKLNNPKEKYAAKMEIEFSFKNGINARKFHESIMKGDDFILPNEKIVWDTLSTGYRTEIIFKNRGPYVP